MECEMWDFKPIVSVAYTHGKSHISHPRNLFARGRERHEQKHYALCALRLSPIPYRCWINMLCRSYIRRPYDLVIPILNL